MEGIDMKTINFSQKGVTLIEIMIALTIAIFIILAMLRVYMTTGKIAAESSIGAQTDSTLMLGLISLDKIIQSIGFDSSTPLSYGSNFAVLSSDGTQLAKNIAGSIFVWKSGSTCHAFINENNGLFFYGGNTGYTCSTLSKPDNTVTKQQFINTRSSPIQNSTNRIGEYEFKVIDGSNCTAFGIKNSNTTVSGLTGKYLVEITAYSYAASSESTARPIRNITCLMNP